MIKRNKQKRIRSWKKWTITAAVVCMTGFCTTFGTAQAKEDTLASRGSLIYEAGKGRTERLEWYAEDLLLLKEKLSTIPDHCFDPACYTHVHNWVYQNINESTHTKHCDGCGSAFDSTGVHAAVREERCVISHAGQAYPGRKSICECGRQWMLETSHTLLHEPIDAVNHKIRCALDGSVYCRGYESVTEEHYAYYYVPDEDGTHHGKICLDCDYREEEPCSFTLEEAPMQGETEDETPKEDQTVQDEGLRWCVCGNCSNAKQEDVETNPEEEPVPVVGEPPEMADTPAPAGEEEPAPPKSPETPEVPADEGTEPPEESEPPEPPADEVPKSSGETAASNISTGEKQT